MKFSKKFVWAGAFLFLLCAASAFAQFEINPDHFDSIVNQTPQKPPVAPKRKMVRRHMGSRAATPQQLHVPNSEATRAGTNSSWKGWHAFRRGNATLLASEKDREAAALMLRHRSSAVTDRHYVKASKQERRVMDEKDRQGVEQRKGEAAQAIGAAFRRAVN
jgi:hypothetical protein